MAGGRRRERPLTTRQTARLGAHGLAWLVLATASALPAAGQDYPQWRGPDRDGGASGFVAPDTWPDSLTLRWRVTVGEAHATPLVVRDTVYVFTRRDGREVLSALDAGTGALRWATSYEAPYEMYPATAAHGPGPKATPLFHRGRVYTHGIGGAVTAFDAETGATVWQHPAPEGQPLFGTAVSPVAEGDLVIVHPGYDPLTAFDAATGEIRWSAGDQGLWSSPVVATLDGVRQAVSIAWQQIEGLALDDGEVLWSYPIDPQLVHAVSPIRFGDLVLVTGQDSGVKALRPSRSDAGWEVDLVWETRAVETSLSNPVIVGDLLVGLSERRRGQYFALHAATGEVAWLGEPRQAENTAVVRAGDLAVLLDDDAELLVAAVDPAGLHPVRRYTVADGATWAQPVLSGRRLFVKDVDTLARWDIVDAADAPERPRP